MDALSFNIFRLYLGSSATTLSKRDSYEKSDLLKYAIPEVLQIRLINLTEKK